MKTRKSVILLFILLFRFTELKFAEEVDNSSLNLKTTKLGTIPDIYNILYGICFAPNGRRFACVITYDKDKWSVVVDGKKEKKYNDVSPPIFSSDSKQIAYKARESNKWLMVRNGRESKRSDYIGEMDHIVGNPIFSPDSKQFAYAANEGYKFFYVVNGQEKEKYFLNLKERKFLFGSESYPPIPRCIFSSNSKHFVYTIATEAGKKWNTVIDGRKGKEYDYIYGLFFSPNTQRFAYIAEEKDKKFIVLDGIELKKYDNIQDLTFSFDNKQLVYTAKKGNKWFVVINGQENEKFDQIHGLHFSPDNKQLAFVSKKDNKKFVVLNGQENKMFDYIYYDLVFSPDSKRFAYTAGEMDKEFVILDGNEGKKYPYVGSFIFSPNSKHFAYKVAIEKNKSFVVLDNRELQKYDEVSSLTFSPDSKYLCYGARDGLDIWWVVEEVK